jgi:anoctamin-10
VYHFVTWTHEQGGAGITPGHGDWKRVTSSFPPQDALANRQLLKYLAGKTVLKDTDLDRIRALFGEKVSFRMCKLVNQNQLTHRRLRSTMPSSSVTRSS